MSTAIDFEILGHAIPDSAKPVAAYLGAVPEMVRADTALPKAVADLNLLDQEVYRAEQAKRFRWLCKFLQVHPGELYGLWLNDDILLEEAQFLSALSPTDFQAESRTLGPYMLRRELRLAPYYRQVRRFLATRIWHNDNVLILGPTAGSEVEIAEDVGGFPFLCAGEGEHAAMCVERLLHDRVVFEPTTMESLQGSPPEVHFIVLTHYLVEPRVAARQAYNLLGLYGWVICPADCDSMVEELESLGLVRRDSQRPSAALFFKHVGLPECIGANT